MLMKTITPCLYHKDVDAAVERLAKAFGFKHLHARKDNERS